MAAFYMARQLKMCSEEETANCIKFAKSQTFEEVTLVQMKFQEALLGNCENVGKVKTGFKISYTLNVLN